jgi:hypothetical protein
MTRIAIESARTVLPEVIAHKIQHIAGENDVHECELLSERVIPPSWDQTFPLPRNSRAWLYAEGEIWLLYSDGELYAEPAQGYRENRDGPRTSGSAIWVLTLDDGAEDLRVSRCLLGAPIEALQAQATTPTDSDSEVFIWFKFDVTARGQISVIARDSDHARDLVEETIENLTCDDPDVPALDLRLDDCWEA